MTGKNKRRKLAVLLEEQAGLCYYCERAMTKDGDTRATLDHIVPYAHGGANTIDNLVAACNRCNNRRGHMDHVVFKSLMDGPVGFKPIAFTASENKSATAKLAEFFPAELVEVVNG